MTDDTPITRAAGIAFVALWGALVAAPGMAQDYTPGKGLTVGDAKTGVAFKFSGHINQALNFADDGASTGAYLVDNGVSPSRFRMEAATSFGETMVTGIFEMGVSPNSSYAVSQTSRTSDDPIRLRRADLQIRNDAFGRFSIGHGSGAADSTAEFDLSLVGGPIMYSGVADIVGGLFFTDEAGLTDTVVGTAFRNFDGARSDRIRYESPMLAGLQALVSYNESEVFAAALTFGGDYGAWSGVELGTIRMIAAVSYTDPNTEAVDYRVAASASFLHQDTGLSLTLSGGTAQTDGGDDPYNYYVKAGYDVEWSSHGATGFGIDWTNSGNVSGAGDTGQSLGFAVVQKFDAVGLDIYGQLRYYSVDRASSPDFNDITVGTLGARLKF